MQNDTFDQASNTTEIELLQYAVAELKKLRSILPRAHQFELCALIGHVGVSAAYLRNPPYKPKSIPLN